MEVGSYKGASLDAAWPGCHDVPKYAIEIEPTEELKEVVVRIPNAKLIEGNYFDLSLGEHIAEPIGVFFYDGDHATSLTYKALAQIEPFLAKQAVVFMDDIAYPAVFRAWREWCKGQRAWTITHEFWIERCLDIAGWWNGLGIAEFERD